MADFRQLALEFVLEDDEAKLTSIARRAASEIETAPASSNPVARWVEAVQPWMPGGVGDDDDDAMRDDGDTPDWPARAKALEFLSRTLHLLDRELLKPSQIKLLVAFFGAMFDVDHTAGIMASATALSRIAAMKSFQPQSARDILQMVCALKDDFPRQIAKTRLAIYELLRLLITDAAVARQLQSDEGGAASMSRLLRLCQNERDPDCLMVWFDVLRSFSTDYSPSQDMLDEVFGSFKAYFPITVPRASQSGVTPEMLKLQLRRCFSSNGRLAPQALPFLLEKLDQGDGVTVNVKVDILRTLRACIEEYSHPEQSVAPYATRTWNSLKYEVRNGDVEDTVWAALEVFKALTTRLAGDELRDFALTVTRECVSDLSNQAYAAAAGRLLISVLSADARAFALMVSPAVLHIKENLGHPKSPTHKQDLLKILRVMLETRLLLADVQMTDQEKADFAATDSVFRPLYGDVYRSMVEAGRGVDASYDDIKLSTEAVQGAGALVCQRPVRPSAATGEQQKQPQAELLLPEETCADICDALFSIAARSWHPQPRQAGSDELINESIRALRRSTEAYPLGFWPLLERGLATIRNSYDRAVPQCASIIQRVSSVLAFVGCSGLRPSLTHAMRCFLGLSCALTSELLAAMDDRRDAGLWCALMAGIESSAHYFKDAFTDVSLEDPLRAQRLQQDQLQGSWLSTMTDRYPVLRSMGVAGTASATADVRDLVVPDFGSAFELRDDFLLACLVICRHLYRRATKPLEEPAGVKALGFGDDFTGSDRDAEYRYLSMLSELASFVVGEMNRSGPSALQFEVFFLTLFRDDYIPLPAPAAAGDVQPAGSWSWLAGGPLNVLAFGLLKSLPPSGVARLFDMGVAQRMLLDGTASHDEAAAAAADALPVTRAMLAVLANKYPLETLDDVMAAVERHLQGALRQAATGPGAEARRRGLDRALTVFTLAGSLARRSTGARARALLELLRRAPDIDDDDADADADADDDGAAGYRLARGLELVTAPQPFVTDSVGAVQRPLWMQKVYVEVVRPMMDVALAAAPLPSSSSTSSAAETRSRRARRANHGVAVLHMVKHMRFAIYEADADAAARIAIAAAQGRRAAGPDARAALEVLRAVLAGAPDAARDHVRSVVQVCAGLVAGDAADAVDADDAEAAAACGALALDIVGCLPRTLEARHLVPHAPGVQRGLAAACGHRVRELRRLARVARAAWADLK